MVLDGTRRARCAAHAHAERIRRRTTTAFPTWSRSGSPRHWSSTSGHSRFHGLERIACSVLALEQTRLDRGFVYCACAALRLARFNTQHRRRRQALLSRAAESRRGVCWLRDWCGPSSEYDVARPVTCSWLAWALTMFAGLTMVSNLRFYSGKDINLRKSVPLLGRGWHCAGARGACGFREHAAGNAVPAVSCCYALSGYVVWHARVSSGSRDRRPPCSPPTLKRLLCCQGF